ncbi:MAG: proline--tRNA ligase [Methanomassiliicoccales archaeon]
MNNEDQESGKENAANASGEAFTEWYNTIVEETGLTDKRYPVKGMNVWPYYGWKAMSLIDGIIRRSFDSRNHQEVYFPLLIPKNEFEKEKEHIKGFDAQVFWVMKAGENDLDIPLLLRPTSETAMYPIFSLWIRSHADLPLKVYQIVNTFRYETKQTRAFIRVREIHFIEGHTCHATFEDAEGQIKEDLEIMNEVAANLCIPYRIHKRTEWDKFPGAYYTYGVDIVLPDGRTLQVASVHQYRTNFSVPYSIYYEDETGDRKPVHQTTYGMSERLLGAVVAVHGDEKGLFFPPSIAPYQVVVIPIPVKGKQELISRGAAKIMEILRKGKIRAMLDDRDIRPGNKFFEWERKGVPLRIEVGSREIDEDKVTVARRDSGEKVTVTVKGLCPALRKIMKDVERQLLMKAKSREKGFEKFCETLEEVSPGLNKVWWCGSTACGTQMEERTGYSVLGSPPFGKNGKGKCVICSADTETIAVLGRPV